MIELPVTLDTFYDRILLDIQEEDDQEIAIRALKWLAAAARPISLEELAEAAIIQPETYPYVCDGGRFLDHKDLLEVLPSGLVTTIPFRPVPTVGSSYVRMEMDATENEALVENERPSAKLTVQFAHFSVKE
jgi:hypothetical protein